MKRQFVEMLQEGDVVNDYFVATRKDLRDQQNGRKFLGMVFKDRTGEVGGILWQNAPAVAKLFEVGDVVNVRGTVGSYQDRLQVRVDQVLPLREEEYELSDLVYVPEDESTVFDRFVEALGTIQNPHLNALTQAILNDDALMAQFRGAAAGKKWHHPHRGGLLRHCYEMARIAEVVCELYPRVDRDILLAAILIHDIGKVAELTQGLYVDYSTPGKLLGHLVIGYEIVQRKIDAIDGFPETLRLQLQHCVLSHHGSLENGSPVVPKTLEAVVLNLIDNLSAQADAINRVVEETAEKGDAWSQYLNLIDRQVWTKRDEWSADAE